MGIFLPMRAAFGMWVSCQNVPVSFLTRITIRTRKERRRDITKRLLVEICISLVTIFRPGDGIRK